MRNQNTVGACDSFYTRRQRSRCIVSSFYMYTNEILYVVCAYAGIFCANKQGDVGGGVCVCVCFDVDAKLSNIIHKGASTIHLFVL